uniref:Uncharacterized protein n=1 Tax=viral metagenome TaxID=1070528 RepID=A0A6H1ZP84_9ZZZZ
MKYNDMKKAAEKKDAMSDLTPTFYQFEKKGDGFVGRLKHVVSVQSSLSEGSYNQYLFDTDDGLIKCAFGAATDKEVEAVFKVGNVYSVEFLGKLKISNKRTVNKFSIMEIDEAAIAGEEQNKDVPF